MIKLYHTRIQDQPMAVDCLPYLKESERRRLEATSPLTAKRRWALLYMIQNLCQETGLPLSVLSCLWHSADGKPYLGPYYMSVSYSGAFAFCAFSKENIGIDAERMDPRNAERLIPVFNEFYGMGVQDTGSFYKEWTKLESLIKYDGAESISSMIHSAKRLDVIHTSYLTLEDGYMIAVSTENDKRILPVHIA